MPIHETVGYGAIHGIVNGTYADATARGAASGFLSTDVNKVYRQLDNDSLWIVLSVSGGVPTWSQVGGSSGGLTNFTEAVNTAAPNATIPVVSLTANNAATDVDVAIEVKGNGAFTLQTPDNNVPGGNKRGHNAVDLQISRTNVTDVSSGDLSFTSGASNQASGIGSSTLGTYGSDFGILGKVTFGISYNNVVGKCQSSRLTLGELTNDATPTVLLTDRLNGSAANSQLILQDEQAVTFTGRVIAKKVGTADVASWSIQGCILRNTGAATTSLVASTVTVITNTPGWTLALTADTTNGGLTITFTGAAATAIRFCCSIDTAEILS